MKQIIKPSGPLQGEVRVGADKSISHRAVIFSSLAKGEGIVRNFLPAADTFSSCSCMRQLGIEIKQEGAMLQINGRGLEGFTEPESILDCGNSGTTMRLLTGLLSARPFFSVLSGDGSLNNRPMQRVINPLTSMGAEIYARRNGSYPPLAIRGRNLKSIDYNLPVASAQVKSALLLAGLTADGTLNIKEPKKSRDHTERMLKAMGAKIKENGLDISLIPGMDLNPQEFIVPGDISSAAFFLVAAAIVPGSELIIKEVGLNPTRAGIIEVLVQMGAKIKLENEKIISGEPIADLLVSGSELKAVEISGDIIPRLIDELLLVSGSELKAVEISGDIIPRLIDELPIIAVAMAAAEGESVVRDAGELRVKETDRIAAITLELGKMGIKISELEDGFVIAGKGRFTGAKVDSHGDHRIAMSLAAAALRAEGETEIHNPDAVNISFPGFWQELTRIR